MTYVFVNDSAVPLDMHFDVRLGKWQHRIKHTKPERDMEHDLYPVFLFELNHANKNKAAGVALKLMLLNYSIKV